MSSFVKAVLWVFTVPFRWVTLVRLWATSVVPAPLFTFRLLITLVYKVTIPPSVLFSLMLTMLLPIHR